MAPEDLLGLLFAAFIFFFYIRPVKGFSKGIKCLLCAILIFNGVFSYLYSIAKMTPADIGFSRCSSIIIEISVYTFNFILAFTLLRLVISFALRKLKSPKAPFFYGSNTFCAVLILAASALISGSACINGMMDPVIASYEVEVKSLPKEADNFLVVQLSDLHINAVTPKEEVLDIVQRVNALNADLIVITGDFLDGKIENVGELVSTVFSLKAKYGIYAVSGNHELYWGYKEWLGFLKDGGIEFLENKGTVIKNENGVPLFNLCGVTDKKAQKYNEAPPDVEAALSSADRSLPVIALSHRPKWGKAFKDRAALAFTGHTHGGMMPGLDILAAAFNSGMVHDMYEIGSEKLIVSRGTRINMAGPLRLFNDAQIVTVRLKAVP